MLRGYVAQTLYCYNLHQCMLRVHKMAQHSQLVQVGAPRNICHTFILWCKHARRLARETAYRRNRSSHQVLKPMRHTLAKRT